MGSAFCKCVFPKNHDCFGRWEAKSNKSTDRCSILTSMPLTKECPFYKSMAQHIADSEKYPYRPEFCVPNKEDEDE